MKKYKLRAGCEVDIRAFIKESRYDIINSKIDKDSHNPKLEFSSELELDEIKDILRKIEDGHVMLQTIQPIEKYTGERDYKLE